MILCKTKKEVFRVVSDWKKEGAVIGFVPTMGSLHEGHLSLVKACKSSGYKTVLSIFVNPTQFNDASDFEKYPRELEQDLSLVQGFVDAVFVPSDSEMYIDAPLLTFQFGKLETVMEGKFRPGHFNGVGIVVSKLFNIIQPDVAFFGQKDLQQCAVVEQLVRDLSFPIKIVRHPIIRESDGLAMSSRNKRLSVEERKIATIVFKALLAVEAAIQRGDSIAISRQKGLEVLKEEPLFRLDYLEVVDSITLESVNQKHKNNLAVCIAVFLGEIRLIDNILILN